MLAKKDLLLLLLLPRVEIYFNVNEIRPEKIWDATGGRRCAFPYTSIYIFLSFGLNYILKSSLLRGTAAAAAAGLGFVF